MSSGKELEAEPSHTITYYGSGNRFDVRYMIKTGQVHYFDQEEPISLALKRVKGRMELLERLDEEYAGSNEA